MDLVSSFLSGLHHELHELIRRKVMFLHLAARHRGSWALRGSKEMMSINLDINPNPSGINCKLQSNKYSMYVCIYIYMYPSTMYSGTRQDG